MNANNYNTQFRIGVGVGAIITLMLLSALVVQAQDPAQLKEIFARSQQQNAQALKQYAWKSRNEVRKNGESKSTQLFLMRYDADGNIQKSQIGGSAPPAMPKGPILGRIAQKKREDFMELINNLREQVKAYSQLPPEKMQAFLASATITARLDQGIVQIQGENILQRGDSMSIWLDAKTRRQRRIEVNTFLEQDPVKAAIEFSDLPGGPTYMARTVVDYPKDALQLITENFDYQRESAQSAPNSAAKQGAAITDKGWPRTFTNGATSFAVYQPQIDEWKDNKFEARAAVAVTTGQSKQPTYGVIWFAARTEIDKVNRLVTMTDFVITKVNFPTHPDKATAYQSLLQAQMLKTGEVIALDRLLAEMAITDARTSSSGYQLKNEPPIIFFSTRQAILVLIDGEPVLRPVKDTSLNRVVNTRVLILQNQETGKYYLHLMDGWMESDAAIGPWSVAWRVPSDLKKALAAAAQTRQVDLLDGSGDKKPSLSEAAMQDALPVIYVSLNPAELLQTQGEPQLALVEGTQLVYVTNSENDIFVDTAMQDHYVLISGRWFRSKSMKGQWEYVAGDRLPPDFAKIPPTHEKASVLASVPGTPQAREALIANEIPQTATISRSAATLTVDYDGQPQFKPIEETTLKYAVNASTPVIAVSANSYYAVMNGVWFVASSATGPWTVATSVPTTIYAIPPSSPVHNVTYVKVYGSTPETVYVGYTPGYYGTVVSSDSVVVYGTGWYYPPYIGSYWYGWGYTYGYGAGFTWSAYTGWGVAFGIGYGWSSYYYPGAWYAAAWGYYPAVWGGVAAANVYGNWGNVAYSGTRAAWANPYTGNVGQGGIYSGVNTATGTRYNGRGFTNTNVYTGTTVSGVGGAAYNPYTGRGAAGQAGAVSNAYTGNAAVGARGASYNPQTGVISAGAGGATYNAATGEINAAGRGFAYNTKTDTGVAVGKNNVYAGKDGEVYRYNKSDGLQQHTSSGWSSVSRPADAQHFQNQQTARATGQQRWENFRSSGGPRFGSGNPKFGSGGPRFGRRR